MIRYLYMSLIAQGLLVACTAIPARQALGGIMLASVPEASYINFSNQSQFDAIGTFSPGASGTLIAPNWVLTAGHLGVNVNNFRVRGTGQSYAVAEVVQHPTFIVNNQNINLGYDIQLVRLVENVPNVTPASIYRGNLEAGATIAITGFGLGGFGDTGESLSAIQRAGTNTVDVVASFVNGAQNAILVADFDSEFGATHNTLAAFGSSSTPLSLEYHLATGDSGGGIFIFENGQWYLAGVSSGVESQAQFLPNLVGANTDLFGYGALSYFTRVSAFQGFIDNVTAVPEPSSFLLFGSLAVGAVAARRMRNKPTV